MIIYWVWSLPLYLRPRSLFCEIPRRLRKSAGVHGHRGVVPKIFICLHSTSSLVRLISSNGRASRSSAFNRISPRSRPPWKNIVSPSTSPHPMWEWFLPIRGSLPQYHSFQPLERRCQEIYTSTHRSTHKHGLLNSASSSQSRRRSYSRLHAGYSRSLDLNVHSLPRL